MSKSLEDSLRELFTLPEDYDPDASGRRITQLMKARVKADPIGRAVAMFSEMGPSQQEEFVECLRLITDLEALKVALLAWYERDTAEFEAWLEDQKRDPNNPWYGLD